MKASPNVRVGAALAVASALVVVPGRAHAFQCATNEVQLPNDGDTNVPTDALIYSYGSASARLVGPDGSLVPVDVRFIPVLSAINGSGQTEVLVPREALAPNTRYTLESQVWGSRTFTTGAGPSRTPPALPVLLSVEPGTGAGDFGIQRFAGLEFQHQGILVGDIGGLPAFNTLRDLLVAGPSPTGEVIESPGIEWLTTQSSPPAGVGGCLAWPEGAGDRESARFGVLDLAGNFSGWVGVELALPSVEEAEAAAEADRAAAYERTFGKRDGRPPVCTLTPGGASNLGGTAWLTLALASVLHAARRFRRPAR